VNYQNLFLNINARKFVALLIAHINTLAFYVICKRWMVALCIYLHCFTGTRLACFLSVLRGVLSTDKIRSYLSILALNSPYLLGLTFSQVLVSTPCIVTCVTAEPVESRWHQNKLQTCWTTGVQFRKRAGIIFHHRIRTSSGVHTVLYIMHTGRKTTGAWSWLLTSM